MRFVLLFVMCYASFGLLAQKDMQVEDYIPTENIQRQSSNKKKNAPKNKKIDLIIKNDVEGILYGNPCVIEETYKMGFQYTVQTPGLPGSVNGFKLFWNNFKTWNKLIFTRSPFWKMNLTRRVQRCRFQSGDFAG